MYQDPCSYLPALPEPADISHITQQDTLMLQVLNVDCEAVRATAH